MKSPVTKDLAVCVRRDSSGAVYSEVADRAKKNSWGDPESVVIDRKSRILDQRVIALRAEALAELLALPYDENLEWPCVAKKKLPCRCPECVQAGRA